MTCKNCDPEENYPGRIIKTDSTHTFCILCGKPIRFQCMSSVHNRNYGSANWDNYFHSICVAVSSKSPCLSRKIGAILVRDHSIVSTGFNGPSRGIPHCGHERLMKDNALLLLLAHPTPSYPSRYMSECPRRILGYESGTHMELCPAQHAEENAISNAARLGVSTIGTVLYMNCLVPCKNCFGTLINAGIVEIVVDKTDVYDRHTQYLIDNSSIKIRSFNS